MKISKIKAAFLSDFQFMLSLWLYGPVTGHDQELVKLASFNENFEFEYVTAFSRLLGNGKYFPLLYVNKLEIRYSQKPPEAVEGQL